MKYRLEDYDWKEELTGEELELPEEEQERIAIERIEEAEDEAAERKFHYYQSRGRI